MQRQLGLADFTRNLEGCFEYLKRLQDKQNKEAMGAADYNKVFNPDLNARLKKPLYTRPHDSAELARLIFAKFRGLLCENTNDHIMWT